MTSKLKTGDEVLIPWGIGEVRGTVREIYGEPPRQHVVVNLTPELSSYVVDEPTTVALHIEDVRKAEVPA